MKLLINRMLFSFIVTLVISGNIFAGNTEELSDSRGRVLCTMGLSSSISPGSATSHLGFKSDLNEHNEASVWKDRKGYFRVSSRFDKPDNTFIVKLEFLNPSAISTSKIEAVLLEDGQSEAEIKTITVEGNFGERSTWKPGGVDVKFKARAIKLRCSIYLN